jgi:hypothetical protein
MLRPFTVFAGVTLALGVFTEASAAERLQNVIRRLSGPEAKTNTIAAKTFRIVGIAVDADGKPLLLCLFDIEQRPSRRFVKQLAEQYDGLRQKGLTVLGLQAAITAADSFKEWKDASSVPFSVGRVVEKADKTKWASEVESLPWLILTDGDRHVTAEGFALDELDAKLKDQAKP